MKQADVKVGGVYLTKVGERLVKVRILETRLDHNDRTEFICIRVDNSTRIPKRLPTGRTAAALRPLPDKVERAAENKTTRSDDTPLSDDWNK